MKNAFLQAVSLAAMASAKSLETLGELAANQNTDLAAAPSGTTDNILNGDGVAKIFSGKLDTIKIVMVTLFFIQIIFFFAMMIYANKVGHDHDAAIMS